MTANIVDFAIIFLLSIAIVYGIILNKKINIIRDSRKELASLFKSFDGTILKAQYGIEELRKVSGEISEQLQKRIDSGAILLDDLTFMVEKTNRDISIINDNLSSMTKKASTAIVSGQKKISNEEKPSPDEIKALKQSATPKDPSTTNRQKSLEKILEQINTMNSSTKKKPSVPTYKEEKSKFDNKNSGKTLFNKKAKETSDDEDPVVNALKALGYGE